MPQHTSTRSSVQLEQQFQARIAQAKEAARLSSIAAAARSQNASHRPPVAAAEATCGVPSRQSSLATVFQSSTISSESVAMKDVPMDVKHRIDRLVEFVARNGDAFEATVRQRERDNPDFAFLRPGDPFSAYYYWKKQQVCSNAPPATAFASSLPPRASSDASNAPASTLLVATDPLGGMSVGAMANVCKYARASGVPPYAPIPPDVIASVGNLPSVEPARLETRMSEFYRQETKNNRRD